MNTSIFRAKAPAIERLFGRRKAVIGVIHSLPLPGSPHDEGETVESIYRFACEEAERYGAGGVDGLIVENHGDIPFARPDELGPETVFVRVNQWANAYAANEGFVEGKAGAASRYRAGLRARDIAIFTDVHVKHGAHAIVADRTLAQLTQDVEFFDADAVIVASALNHGGSWWNPVDPARLAQFMSVVRQVRQTHGVR